MKYQLSGNIPDEPTRRALEELYRVLSDVSDSVHKVGGDAKSQASGGPGDIRIVKVDKAKRRLETRTENGWAGVTFSDQGDIFCRDLFASSNSVWLGDERFSRDTIQSITNHLRDLTIHFEIDDSSTSTSSVWSSDKVQAELTALGTAIEILINADGDVALASSSDDTYTIRSLSGGDGIDVSNVADVVTAALDITGLTPETTIDASDLVVIYDDSAQAIRKMTRSDFVAGLAAGSGYITSGTNIGTGGVAVYRGVSNAILQFASVNADSSKVIVSYNATNDEVRIDIDPSAISHNDLADVGTNSHADIDAHITAHATYTDTAIVSALNGKTDVGHGISDSSSHTGLTGATEGHLMSIDGSGLPADSGKFSSDFAPSPHGLNSADHLGLSSATENNFMGIDSSGKPKDSGVSASSFESAGAVATHENTYDHAQLHIHTNKTVIDRFTEIDDRISYGTDNLAYTSEVTPKADDSAVVHNTGDESIAGSKTFTTIPSIPTDSPTANSDVASKKYVDDSVSAAGGGDMLKSVYDANGNGIVDSSEALSNGGDMISAAAVYNHVNDGDIHVDSEDKTVWNDAATTIDSHTADVGLAPHVTDSERISWNGVITDLSNHDNDDTKHFSGSQESDLTEAHEHISDTDVHIQSGERGNWDGVIIDLSAHVSNVNIHIQSSERDTWNSKPDNMPDLGDVDTSGVSEGDVLKWNATESKWVPGPDLTGGAGNGDMSSSTYDPDIDGVVNAANKLDDGSHTYIVSAQAASEHINDTDIHITSGERDEWNSKGDMKKSTYDTDEDGIVDYSDALGNSSANVGYNDVHGHIVNDEVHRVIDDNDTSAITLWSSNQISAALDTKADVTHTHSEYLKKSGDTWGNFDLVTSMSDSDRILIENSADGYIKYYIRWSDMFNIATEGLMQESDYTGTGTGIVNYAANLREESADITVSASDVYDHVNTWFLNLEDTLASQGFSDTVSQSDILTTYADYAIIFGRHNTGTLNPQSATLGMLASAIRTYSNFPNDMYLAGYDLSGVKSDGSGDKGSIVNVDDVGAQTITAAEYVSAPHGWFSGGVRSPTVIVNVGSGFGSGYSLNVSADAAKYVFLVGAGFSQDVTIAITDSTVAAGPGFGPDQVIESEILIINDGATGTNRISFVDGGGHAITFSDDTTSEFFKASIHAAYVLHVQYIYQDDVLVKLLAHGRVYLS